MKIVYVIASLETSGGTERIVSEKANYLADVFGYDVTIICYDQHENSSNFYFLSDNVEQRQLGLQMYSQYRYAYPKRLWKKYVLRSHLKRALSKVVKEINPDFLIGISHFRADIVCTIDCKTKKIIECHVPRSFIENTNNKYINDIYKRYYDMRYFHVIEKKADMIITLTERDRELWSEAKRVETIPNFSNIHIDQVCDHKKKRVITVGRLSKEKGFDRLLVIWKLVVNKHPDWHLDIFGDGDMKNKLEQKIKLGNITNVTLCGTTNQISKELSKSSICVSTSYYEGFSLVLLEAITHGVPCVAFDCPYGPRTIIEDGKCGYLVENGHIPQFVEKLCTLMENEQLRLEFSKASIERSKFFNIDAIMLQWKKLFEEL